MTRSAVVIGSGLHNCFVTGAITKYATSLILILHRVAGLFL